MASAETTDPQQDKSKWDFFTVFLSAMGILTFIMAILCLVTAFKVKSQSKLLKRNLGYNEEVKEMLQDPKVRKLVKEYKKMAKGGDQNQDKNRVKKIIRQLVQRAGKLQAFNFSSRQEDNGYLRETYTVRLSLRSLRNFIDCSYHLQMLPGIKVDTLNLSQGEDKYFPWDATFTVTSFTQSATRRE